MLFSRQNVVCVSARVYVCACVCWVLVRVFVRVYAVLVCVCVCACRRLRAMSYFGKFKFITHAQNKNDGSFVVKKIPVANLRSDEDLNHALGVCTVCLDCKCVHCMLGLYVCALYAWTVSVCTVCLDCTCVHCMLGL